MSMTTAVVTLPPSDYTIHHGILTRMTLTPDRKTCMIKIYSRTDPWIAGNVDAYNRQPVAYDQGKRCEIMVDCNTDSAR